MLIHIEEHDLRDLLDELRELRARRDELLAAATLRVLADREKKGTLRAQVEEFMRAFGQHIEARPTVPPADIVRLRALLVFEEACEFVDAVLSGADRSEFERGVTALMNVIQRAQVTVDMEAAVDALADLDYVSEGSRLAFGIEGAPIARAVHAANMAKAGGPIDPATGKKLKPAGWAPPDVLAELRAQGWGA